MKARLTVGRATGALQRLAAAVRGRSIRTAALAAAPAFAALVLSACEIDARINPTYGCSVTCRNCMSGFCYDAPAMPDGGPSDASTTPDADPAPPDAAPPCDAQDSSACDECDAGCAPNEVCCGGTCAASCSTECGNEVVETGEECDGGPLCSISCTWLFDESLVHRYEFTGTGDVVTDSVGGKDGMLVNAVLNGSGDLVLAGGMTDQYVNLPNGLLRTLASVTLEIWVTWTGTSEGERLFDFGFNTSGENRRTGILTSGFYLTPRDADGNMSAHINFTQEEGDVENDALVRSTALSDRRHQVVVVFDGTADMLELYLDGAFLDRARDVRGWLAQIDDRNVWIGRANGPGASLKATVHEFRIYRNALKEEAIAASYTAGSDPR